jgi:mono/diheme cytochrome c family protein
MKKIIAACIVFSIVIVACHKKSIPAVDGSARYKKSDVATGQTVYETKCKQCHALKNTENFAAEKWPGIMKSMAPKAKLTEEETNQVTAYVMTHAKKAS